MAFNLKTIFVIVFINFLVTSNIFANDPRTSVRYDTAANILVIMHITDTHIGQTGKEDYNSELTWLLRDGVNTVKPALVVNTGDLTDADTNWLGFSSRLFKLGPPQKDEWLKYEELTKNVDTSQYFDVPGNHDRYGDQTWEGFLYEDGFHYGYTRNSVLGKTFLINDSTVDTTIPVGQFSKIVTLPNGDNYLFVGANTCEKKGSIWSVLWSEGVSDKPELSAVERVFEEVTSHTSQVTSEERRGKHLIVFTNWYLFPMGFGGGGSEPRYLSFWLEEVFKNRGYKVTGIDFTNCSENDYYGSRSSYYWNAKDLKKVFSESAGWSQYLRSKDDRLTSSEWSKTLNREWSQIVAMNSPVVEKGKRYTQNVPVSRNDKELRLIVSSGNQLVNKVYNNKGYEIDLVNDPKIKFSRSGIYDVYAIQSPDAGIWQVVCDAANITNDSTKVEIEALSKGGTRLAVGGVESGEWRVGGKVSISCAVTKGDVTDSIHSVKFQMTSDERQATSDELYDDGLHGDGLVSDGIYCNDFEIGTLEGKYDWKVRLEGLDRDGYKIVSEEVGKVNIEGSPPLVTYLSPVGTIVEESPEIEFSVEDDGVIDSVQVKMDGCLVSGLASWRVDWVLSPGEHVVEIIAWDNAKHQSAPEAKKFSVADKVADIVDVSGDANGGEQISKYPAGISQNDLDIEGLRLYANPKGVEITVAKDLTGSQIYDVGVSINVGAIHELPEFAIFSAIIWETVWYNKHLL